MYLVIKIDKGGSQSSFTLDLEGLNLLFKMATPSLCSFIIERIS